MSILVTITSLALPTIAFLAIIVIIAFFVAGIFNTVAVDKVCERVFMTCCILAVVMVIFNLLTFLAVYAVRFFGLI